jgi:hypothetical protein
VRNYQNGGTFAYWSDNKIKAQVKKTISTETPTAPSAPTNLIVTSKSTSQISLGWSDVATNETSYEIERCDGLGCSSFVPVSGLSPLGADATAASDTTILPSTYYSFRVRAVECEQEPGERGSSGYEVAGDLSSGWAVGCSVRVST